MSGWQIAFWCLVAAIVYAYALFPLLVVLRSWLWRRPYRSAPIEPTVSLVIVAHNEAAGIAAKLDNVLSLDYPRQKLQVIVASDGSSDDTAQIVRGYAERGIELLNLPRQGKIPALNAAVAAATGEVLVFSDANSMYNQGAVRALVAPLADPTVGGVAGDQRYFKDRQGTSAGEQAYWSFDRWMKQCQSRSGSTTSATGAIYCIRRALFRTCPGGVTDDFATSTAVIAQGYRLVFSLDAAAYEPAAKAHRAEFGRKVRVTTRGLWGVVARRELLNPLRHGFYSLQLCSHKILRRLVAFPLLALLAIGPWLWNAGPFYRAAALAQAAFYAWGVLGLALAGTRLGRAKPLAIPAYFCLINAAALVASWQVLRGHRIERWEPQRQADAPALPPLAGCGAATLEQSVP